MIWRELIEKSSRYSDGNVPNVNRNDDGNVNVNRYNPQNRNPNLRARLEVSRQRILQQDSFSFGYYLLIYEIHPFSILDISTESFAILRYVFSSSIPSSCSVRITCFKTSIVVLAASSIFIFSCRIVNAASISNVINFNE